MPILELNGQRIEVDDSFLSMTPEQQNATVDEIERSLGGNAAAAPQQSPQYTATANELSSITRSMDQPKAEPAPSTAAYLLQRGDRGVADALGAPVDLMTGALNIGAFGVDKAAQLFGGSFPGRIENPIGGSNWIADKASEAGDALGTRTIADEEVSPGIRKLGIAARGAGSTLVPGMGLASRAAQGVEKAGAPILNRTIATLAEPYAANPGATLTRDALAGAGSAVAAQEYDDRAPDALQDSVAGPFVKMGLSILGGLGASTAASVAEAGSKGAFNFGRNLFRGKADPNSPINPATGQPFTRTDMDMAARVAQALPTDKAQAVANIEKNANEFRQVANPSQMPTTGMLADDIGLASQENILRTQDPQRFAERDAARRSKASSLVDETAPANAQGRNFTSEASRQYNEKLDAAGQNVKSAEAAQEAAAQDIARQNAELEAFRANQPQVSTALSDEFNAARKAARQEKNALYDAADPKTPVDGRFLDEALNRIDSQMSNAERAAPGPYSAIAGRVRQLREGGDITYGDVKALRAQVSEARKNAVAASGQSVAGSGADVQRLDQLGEVLGYMADQVNPDAAKHYRENFAPRFKQGKAGEFGAQIDRAARTGGESSATRPSDFAGKFLAKPEDAASLKRALTPAEDASLTARIEGPGAAPSGAPAGGLAPQTEQNIREWMLGDLAKSGVLNNNAEIRFDRFKKWADKNRATIDQFPSLRDTVDSELAQAQRSGALSRQLSADVAAAKEGMANTKRELDRSALRFALDNSPENAVAGIMKSGDPDKRMAEIVGRLKGNQQAIDGLKAATRDWIKQSEAGLSSKIVGDPDAVRLSVAKMQKLFQKHEKTLAKIYSPEEMNALRQAHKLMNAETKLDVRATAGSNSVDKMFAAKNQSFEQGKRLLEAALSVRYGVLVGGGMIRKINMFLQTMPDGDKAIRDVLFEMQFNPDLAVHLLTRPIKEIDTKPWNAKLNRLLAYATGAREANEGDDKKPLELTVTRKDTQQ
jgi:hypothetical protein